MNHLTIKTFIESLGTWQSIADIVCIAAGLYFLYRTLLRLGTWRIVAGILVALLIYHLASLLGLEGLEWIFGNLSQVALIALVIIFQPEIRKLFERAVSIRRSEKKGVSAGLAKIIAGSLVKMAFQHCGAIVVFPGKEPISEWLSGGYRLDAKPSVPLITSIFDTGSPGHDGALIVEKGKFVRFGVRLPVSQSSNISEEYGTRHHAAMGLAEKSDALVLVVSEERGKIALFKNGSMTQIDNMDELSAEIILHQKRSASLYTETYDGRSRLRFVSELFVSFMIATLVWASIIFLQGEVIDKIISVPVTYVEIPSNSILTGEKQEKVQLHLSGTKADLASLDTGQLNVKIDLSTAEKGRQTLPINSENLEIPRKIRVIEIIPPSVEITLSEIEQQIVAIKPQLIGKLPRELKIKNIKLFPDKILVLSPASKELNESISLTTTPIYLESIIVDTKLYCKIIAPPTVQPVTKPWPDIEVKIEVGKK
jgi:uncharacterized protein (TIGR00159 family)